jgi:Tol biopolymer transport system component
MKLLVAVLMLLSLNSLHAEMVFMRETEVEGAPLKHIFLKKNNGEVQQLTDGKEAHLYPDISSDGRSIVFVEGKIDSAQTDLKLTVLNRGKKLTLNVEGLKGMILHPKFSKNGELLYFSAPSPMLSGKNSVFYMKTEQWKKTTVDSLSVKAQALDEKEEQYFPRPSADGQFVIYQRNTGKKREIILFDTLEQEKTVIDEGMSPSLSFDENTIAYTSKKSGTWDIYEYNRVSKKITRRTFDETADEMAPTFNATNELFIASNKTGHFNLYKVQNYNWEQITSINDGDDYAPQFSGEVQYRQGTLAPFMEPLRSSFGTLNHEGKIYMCGGHQGPEHTYPKESFTDDFNAFDTATGKWTALAPRLHKAHGFQIAARGNYIYAFGGFAYSEDHKPNWKSLDVIERYDISKNEWKVIGKMPRARSSNVAITLGDKVYLVGGWDSTPKFNNDFDGTFQSKIDIFDLRSETMTEAPFTMPLPLRRALTGLEHDGKLLLVGGLGVGATHFSLISKVTEIDPLDGSVFEYPELPFATFAPAAEKIGNELFVFGGMFKFSEMSYEYVPHIYSFDFNKNNWRHTGRYLKESKGFSQVFKLDETSIGILGGHRYMQGEDKPVNTFEFFTSPGSK